MLDRDRWKKELAEKGWTETMVSSCREFLEPLLNYSKSERQFLENLLDRGEITPELITDDPRLREIILEHPRLAWRARQVRENSKRGSSSGRK